MQRAPIQFGGDVAWHGHAAKLFVREERTLIDYVLKGNTLRNEIEEEENRKYVGMWEGERFSQCQLKGSRLTIQWMDWKILKN